MCHVIEHIEWNIYTYWSEGNFDQYVWSRVEVFVWIKVLKGYFTLNVSSIVHIKQDLHYLLPGGWCAPLHRPTMPKWLPVDPPCPFFLCYIRKSWFDEITTCQWPRREVYIEGTSHVIHSSSGALRMINILRWWFPPLNGLFPWYYVFMIYRRSNRRCLRS